MDEVFKLITKEVCFFNQDPTILSTLNLSLIQVACKDFFFNVEKRWNSHATNLMVDGVKW